MKDILDKKLSKISDIWNDYIWEYKFCHSKIKFTDDVKSNYFGDIINYLSDTLNIIYQSDQQQTLQEHISKSISFLQAIYVQQDFVEELLHIFKCKIDKGNLKQDLNYQINRNLRNELIGHPVRKEDKNGTRQLLSSTLFSNSKNSDQISYLRYHRDNGYKLELVVHEKKDILKRHSDFLNNYFDSILERLKRILASFKLKIEETEKVIDKISFPTVIKLASLSFEYIFNTCYLFKPNILLQAYEMKSSNLRYENAIQFFLNALKQLLSERRKDIESIIDDASLHDLHQNISVSEKYEIIFVNGEEKDDVENLPITYHYEMGKLVSKENLFHFKFFSSILRDKCKENNLVLQELDNMENNLENDLEYYCSYYLIDKILK